MSPPSSSASNRPIDWAAIRVEVIDNGRGLKDQDETGGAGLIGMSERLAMMGGSLRISSQSGSTRLVAAIPDSRGMARKR